MADRYQCSDDDFMIRSDDKDEVIDVAHQHTRNRHGMDVDRSEIEQGVETI